MIFKLNRTEFLSMNKGSTALFSKCGHTAATLRKVHWELTNSHTGSPCSFMCDKYHIAPTSISVFLVTHFMACTILHEIIFKTGCTFIYKSYWLLRINSRQIWKGTCRICALFFPPSLSLSLNRINKHDRIKSLRNSSTQKKKCINKSHYKIPFTFIVLIMQHKLGLSIPHKSFLLVCFYFINKKLMV